MLNGENIFTEDQASEDGPKATRTVPWKVLIVDDEEPVHSVTELVLSKFQFEGRPLQFLHAYSGNEARELIEQHNDIALALIDVVMETDHAGLELTKYIREELKNNRVRLVLRTGQPGQAPEERVIEKYDINDYKDKTELTSTKMKTLMYAALRSYRDIVALEDNRKGLEMIIDSSSKIFEIQSLQKFTSAVLIQMTALLGLNKDSAYLQRVSSFAAANEKGEFHIIAATGKYEGMLNEVAVEHLPHDIWEQICKAQESKESIICDEYVIFYFLTALDVENILYISLFTPLTETDKKLLDVFSGNAAVAFDNAYLKIELEETQREIVYLLGEAVETRSQETGNHVKRVAEISKYLAAKAGLSPEECELIKSASPLHDIGKIATPDSILHKRGKLDPDEWEIMQQHAGIGHNMLRHSRHKVLQYAAIIAHEHHERWDGKGYPRQLAGEEIHLLGRITAVADVFDALNSERCYKPAWELEATKAYFDAEKGKHFDPHITDLLFDNLSDIINICNRYKD